MIRTVISIDLSVSPREQANSPIHNRWHPDILPVAQVRQNEAFRVECFDYTGNQVKNDDDASDIANIDMDQIHYISGPIEIEGAEPGDLLEVEILDIQPLQGHEWGFTGIANNGFLSEPYNKEHKAIWDFEGIFATSRHIPGVRFAGLIHPGLIGCAPSKSLLDEWNRRERELNFKNPDRKVPMALVPNSNGALVGSLEGTEKGEIIKREAARTLPPREHGGNCDIKNLSRGSKFWLPVYVKGGNLSMGDIHFSQGDGEITFCGGIEMPGAITLKTKVIKDGVALHGMKNPIFLPGPLEPRYTRFLTFEGISVDDTGTQHYLDPKVAYKQACMNCIEYFKKFGYSGEQIYMLLTACPCNGSIANLQALWIIQMLAVLLEYLQKFSISMYFLRMEVMNLKTEEKVLRFCRPKHE